MRTPRSTPSEGDNQLVPPIVRALLAADEEVETRYVLKGAEAYATATRLIIIRGDETASHSYGKIAGMRELTRGNVWLILGGVALLALGGTSAVFPVAGGALILAAVLTRARRLELLVTGVKQPIVLDGAREVLSPLMRRLADKGARKLGA